MEGYSTTVDANRQEHSPSRQTLIAQTVVLASIVCALWVMKVNTFAGTTIEVENGQRVISAGPYRMVRHPMYLSTITMFLFIPLALASYFSLLVFALVIPLIIFRLVNEEKVLRQQLPGYTEYCLSTPFRLIPFVW